MSRYAALDDSALTALLERDLQEIGAQLLRMGRNAHEADYQYQRSCIRNGEAVLTVAGKVRKHLLAYYLDDLSD